MPGFWIVGHLFYRTGKSPFFNRSPTIVGIARRIADEVALRKVKALPAASAD